MPDTPSPLFARMRASLARFGFLARLAWRMAGRAFGLLQKRKAPAPQPAQAQLIADDDKIIEALQTGDIAFLDHLGLGFATSTDAAMGQPWLFNAIDFGTLASLRWFLAQGVALDGVDKDGRSVVQAAVERAAAVDEYDDTPDDPLPLIEALLDGGAAINAASGQGLTPLHVAAALGLVEVVRLLLAHGADPSLRDEGFAHATPLDYAVQAGHQAVADLLR